MIQIFDKRKCCGCTACYNICPHKAILMKPDEEGFLYPVVDEGKCTNCGACENVCPILHPHIIEEETRAFIYRNGNPEIVESSTSGGAFTALAKEMLLHGAIVYGAGYDNNMQVVCKKATNIEQLAEMRGSKFVQSYLGEIFLNVKFELQEGKLVFFTGTPCQIAGLKKYLIKPYDNLVCMDFVCRGVPSPQLWKNYVSMMEKQYESRIIGARFKNKTYGYHASTMKIDFESGVSYYGSGRVDPFMKAFVNEMSSRPSCSECAFKSDKRLSDITLFDCYKFEPITGERDDDKGYTSILVHSEVGMKLLCEISNDSYCCFEVEPEKLIKENGIMVKNSAQPNPQREELYKLIADYPIDKAMQMINPIRKRDYLFEISKKTLKRIGFLRFVKKLNRKSVNIEKRS